MFNPKMSIEQERMKIDPSLAREILKFNTSNRSIRKANVRKMARDMETGEWSERLDDPIRFSTDGRLVDGQHRLLALIESGCTYTFTLQYGLDEKDLRAIDCGARRSPADAMKLSKGKSINRQVIGSIRQACDYGRAFTTLSNSQICDFYESHSQEMLVLEHFFSGGKCALRVRKSPVGAFALNALENNEPVFMVEDFLQSLKSPAEPDVLQPRDRMMMNFSVVVNNYKMQGALERERLYGMTEKAYDAFKRNRNLKSFNPPKEHGFKSILELELI